MSAGPLVGHAAAKTISVHCQLSDVSATVNKSKVGSQWSLCVDTVPLLYMVP